MVESLRQFGPLAQFGLPSMMADSGVNIANGSNFAASEQKDFRRGRGKAQRLAEALLASGLSTNILAQAMQGLTQRAIGNEFATTHPVTSEVIESEEVRRRAIGYVIHGAAALNRINLADYDQVKGRKRRQTDK